ncbi:hypothetical protein, partial [Caldilinea sp.]|uniref:hypothetical protein n=1 Tax=Caldilinea sp. TaxID=2293560 RepID=UPI002C4BF221|nr:hypothetical protein [Caldilinea sp.]
PSPPDQRRGRSRQNFGTHHLLRRRLQRRNGVEHQSIRFVSIASDLQQNAKDVEENEDRQIAAVLLQKRISMSQPRSLTAARAS